MTLAPAPTTPASGPETRRRARRAPAWALVVCLVALLAATLLSLALGARLVPLDAVWDAFLRPDGSTDQAAVLSRVPTTITGLGTPNGDALTMERKPGGMPNTGLPPV